MNTIGHGLMVAMAIGIVSHGINWLRRVNEMLRQQEDAR